MELFSAVPWWILLFFFIGLYATVITLLQLFTGLGRGYGPLEPVAAPPPGSPAFIDTLSSTLDTQVRHGGTVQILNNGAAFFPALLSEIRAARHSIHLMTYIWRPGTLSDEIFEALIERARAGVEVRLMVDGIGGLIGPRKHMKALRRAGGKVAVFAPLFSSHFIHPTKRNHRRAFIFDGRVGFTGGMSVADQWQGDAEDPAHWRDTMVRVTGPMAKTLQVAFAQLWTNVDGEILVGPEYFLPEEGEGGDGQMVHFGVAHSPAAETHSLLHLFWFSFKAARESIYITNSYFAPDRFLRRVLIERARAGLDVCLLLPNSHTDNAFVRWAAHDTYDEFLEAGIRIFEYQPTMIHAKHMVVDDRWTIVGSANIDIRSVSLNQENVLCIVDEEVGRSFKEVMRKDLACAREITLEAWRRRPLWNRLRERAAAVWRAQY